MGMIRVFKATDTTYATNGEVILKPIEAVITKTNEEEYIDLECPLEYADFLIQDNILIVDTLTGKKGYKIHNPIIGRPISVRAWLFWQEKPPAPADRGVVISHGKNLRDCEIDENWDDVVTKLTPIGYKDARLPEGFLSIPSPYAKVYEKEIEFDLTESIEEEVEALEDAISDNEDIIAELENSVTVLQSRYDAFGASIGALTGEKAALINRMGELGDSEVELKEKAVIEAQIPLIDEEITKFVADKTNTKAVLDASNADLITTKAELETQKTSYNNLVIGDLRSQATEYLKINQFPRINYNLEAHLEGILEVGDIVKVKHPAMRVDLLTNVTAYQWDCLTSRYRNIEFGTLKPTLKGAITEIEEKIEDNKATIKKTANSVTKYYSEYKRDNEELVSRFTSELYGAENGIYGLLQKNQSMFRQTASEISGTITRVSAKFGEQIASITLKADQIELAVSQNYTALDGKITSNASKITQTAAEIRSEVLASVTTLDGKISTNKTLISQTATSIRSEVSASVTELNGKISSNASLITQTAIDIRAEVTSTLGNYPTTTQMNSAISQSATSIRSEVNSKFNSYSTTTQMNSAIEQKANTITSQVNTQINGITTEITQIEQTANKISWLVKSGTSSTNFTLTDRMIALVANTISLDAYVTFTNLSQVNTKTTINGGNITTGTLDANKVTVKNLSASNITSGTLNANVVTISNLSANSISTGTMSADRISGGTIDASRITVKNLSASNITSGALEVSYLRGNGYRCLTIGSSNTLLIGGTSSYYDIINVNVAARTCIFGSSGGTVGFFGYSGGTRRSIYTISTSATLSTACSKINEIINALKAYNLIG